MSANRDISFRTIRSKTKEARILENQTEIQESVHPHIGGDNDMQSKLTIRMKFACALVASASVLALSGVAYAQTQSGQEVPQTQSAQQGAQFPSLKEVVVTGSLIKRPAGSSLDLTTVDSQQLQTTGALTATEALSTVTQNLPQVVSATSAGFGTGFASYADLRSLGSDETLVLVNGMRVADSPYADLGVDLNTIPMNVIDRVETLSDGASSIYGSDAIAGVINYITKNEVHGFDVTATTTDPDQPGGGAENSVSGSAGYGTLSDQGWNIYGSITYTKQQALSMASRDFADTYYIPSKDVNRLSSISEPANYNQSQTGVSAINPYAPKCAPPLSIYANGIFGPQSCGYDGGPVNDAIPATQEISYYLHGIGKLWSGATGTFEYMRSDENLTDQITGLTLRANTMTSNNPYYPGNGIVPGTPGLNPAYPISLNWRVGQAGPSVVQDLSHTERYLAHIDGTIWDTHYKVWGLHSDSEENIDFASGYLNVAAMQAGLTGSDGAPFLNPFGNQSAAGLAYVEANGITGPMQTALSTLDMGGIQLNKELFALPGGPLQVSLASDYSHETAAFNANPVLAKAGATGLSTTDISGARSSESATFEALAPILKVLDLDASVRYDSYSIGGSSVNPGIKIDFKPVQLLNLHASYTTGFREPTLYDLFSPISYPIGPVDENDPVLCPGGKVNTAAGGTSTRDCDFGFQVESGGNAHLEPERSQTYTVGFRFGPVESVTFTVDYWNYLITHTIGTLAETQIFGNTTQYASLFIRCSQVPAAQRSVFSACEIPGGNPIAYVTDTYLNLGDTKTDGLDFTFHWSSDLTQYGRFGFDYRGTYTLNYQLQEEPYGPFYQLAGVYDNGFVVIPYIHYATLIWDKGDWTAQIANSFEAGYDDCNAQCAVSPAYYDRVSAYSIWDLIGIWHGPKGVTVTARIDNLLDTDPPFTNKNTGLATGYDERYANPIGREFSLTLDYKF
jgi:iron complex outermembrane receptor protein